MKSIIAMVGCVVVGFIGMQVYMTTQVGESAPRAQVDEDDAVWKDAQAEEARPSVKPAEPAEPPQAPPAPKFHAKPKVQPAKPAPSSLNAKRSASGPMFYTAEKLNSKGVPSRVWIRNTPVGDCLVLMIGANQSDGRLMIRKGTTQGAEKHRWEVAVANGNISVYWDGRRVPPGSSGAR